MKIIDQQTNLSFVPQPNEYQLVLDNQIPPIPLTTSAFGLIFEDGRLLTTKLVKRGWDIPGGHVEPGELPEETVRRELWEETAVIPQTLTLFAHAKVTVHATKPDNYKYPYPVSYLVFYLGRVGGIRPFLPTAEAAARQFFPPTQAKNKIGLNATNHCIKLLVIVCCDSMTSVLSCWHDTVIQGSGYGRYF